MNESTGPARNTISSAALTDPVFVGELRRQMVRFAALQLSDRHQAEDAVQEALLGTLGSSGSFAGRAAYKIWVFAILRNKIADALRERQRSRGTAHLPEVEEPDETPEFFDDAGHWTGEAAPVRWGDPTQALREAQFWSVFEACLENLPAQQARLFMMREFGELESSEICSAASVLSNLNVTLHRARLRLRRCLEHRWFGEEARQC